MSQTLSHTVTHAYEVYGYGGTGPFLVTCEHAANRVPAPLRISQVDRAWLASHWGWDIGARTVSRELVRATHSDGVMATYSRLVVDANRMRGHEQFIRRTVEGWQLTFNRDLEEQEVQRRVDLYHEPYHKAVDAELRKRLEKDGDVILLSVHSFTPAYFGELRHMDIGVLYQPYEAVALRLAGELKEEGFKVALNEPYSASDGMTYSADRHGENHKVVYLELEINQLLIDTPAKARVVARRVADALMRFQVRTKTREEQTT